MKPAEFNENDNSGSIWELTPFGRKDPIEYSSGTRENGEAIILAQE